MFVRWHTILIKRRIIMTKDIKITDYTNSELDYLAEMINEKLQYMGYEPDGGFSFDIVVQFEENSNEWR
jgi:hypothetical protein